VVFGQQAVDVVAARADEEGVAAGVCAGRDLEGVGGRGAIDGLADGVERAGLDAARVFALPLVPVGVELDAALLHHDAEKVFARTE
jgi:hypothetical protein